MPVLCTAMALADAATLGRLFEMGMLLCFGASWPFAVVKTWRSKSIGGKSPAFLALVFLGYLMGICSKFYRGIDWVVWLYAFNGVMVAADMALYLYYRAVGPQAAAPGGSAA